MPKDSKIEEQRKYFMSCLDFVDRRDNLVNKILEIDPDDNHPELLKTKFYDFP